MDNLIINLKKMRLQIVGRNCESKNFIEHIIEGDLASGKQSFNQIPPEPNGYLHIGCKVNT